MVKTADCIENKLQKLKKEFEGYVEKNQYNYQQNILMSSELAGIKETANKVLYGIAKLTKELNDFNLKNGAALHKTHSHPDFEYKTISTPLDEGHPHPPEEEGWEINTYCGVDGKFNGSKLRITYWLRPERKDK